MDFDVRHQPQMHWDGPGFLDFKQELDLGHHPGLPPVNKPARWKKSSRRGRHSTVQGFERLNVRKTRLENEEKTWLINSLPWSYAEAVRNPSKKQPKQQSSQEDSNEETVNGSCESEQENDLKEVVTCKSENNSNGSANDGDSPLNPDANEFVPGVSSDKEDISSSDKDEIFSSESQAEPNDEKIVMLCIHLDKNINLENSDDDIISTKESNENVENINIIHEGLLTNVNEESGVEKLLDFSSENVLEHENISNENNLIKSNFDLATDDIDSLTPIDLEENSSNNCFEDSFVCSDQIKEPVSLETSVTNEVIDDGYKCCRVSFVNELDFEEIVKDKNQYSENNFTNTEELTDGMQSLAHNDTELEGDISDDKNALVETSGDRVHKDFISEEQNLDYSGNSKNEELLNNDNKENEYLDIQINCKNVKQEETSELYPEEIMDSSFNLYKYSSCCNDNVTDYDETDTRTHEYEVGPEYGQINNMAQAISDSEPSEIKTEEINVNVESNKYYEDIEQSLNEIENKEPEKMNVEYDCRQEMNQTSTADCDKLQEDTEVCTDDIQVMESYMQNAENKYNDDNELAGNQITQEGIEHLDDYQENTAAYQPKNENHIILTENEGHNNAHPENIEPYQSECSDTQEDDAPLQVRNDAITSISENELPEKEMFENQLLREITNDSAESDQVVAEGEINDSEETSQVVSEEEMTNDSIETDQVVAENEINDSEETSQVIAENKIINDSAETNQVVAEDEITNDSAETDQVVAENEINDSAETTQVVAEIEITNDSPETNQMVAEENEINDSTGANQVITENEITKDSAGANHVVAENEINESPETDQMVVEIEINDSAETNQDIAEENEVIDSAETNQVIAENEINYSTGANQVITENEITNQGIAEEKEIIDSAETNQGIAENEITNDSVRANHVGSDNEISDFAETKQIIVENEITSDSAEINQSVNEINTLIHKTNAYQSDENTNDSSVSNCGSISINENFFCAETGEFCEINKSDEFRQVLPQDALNNELVECINPKNGETLPQVINDELETTNENKENTVPVIVTSYYDEEYTTINSHIEDSKQVQLKCDNVMMESNGSLDQDSSFEIINESDDNMQTSINEITENVFESSCDDRIDESSQSNEKPDIVHDVDNSLLIFNNIKTQDTEASRLQVEDTCELKMIKSKGVFSKMDEISDENKINGGATAATLIAAGASVVAAGALAVDSLMSEKMDNESFKEEITEEQIYFKEDKEKEIPIKSTDDVPLSPTASKKSVTEATKKLTTPTAGSKVPPKPSSPVAKPKMSTMPSKPDTLNAGKGKPIAADKTTTSGIKGSSPSKSLAKGAASPVKSTNGASKLSGVVGTAATLSVKPSTVAPKMPSSVTKATPAKSTVPSAKPAGTSTVKAVPTNSTKPTTPKPGSPNVKTVNPTKPSSSKPASGVTKPTVSASKSPSNTVKPASTAKSSGVTKPSTPPLKTTPTASKVGPALAKGSVTGPKPGVTPVKASTPKPGTPPVKTTMPLAKPGTPPTKAAISPVKPGTPPTKVAASLAKPGTPTAVTKSPASTDKLKTNKTTLKNVKSVTDKPTEGKTSSKPINKPSTPPTKTVSVKPTVVKQPPKKSETTKQTTVSTTTKPSLVNGNSLEQKSNLIKSGDNTAVKTNNMKTAVKVPTKSASPTEKAKTSSSNKPTSKTDSPTKKTTDKKTIMDKNAINLGKTTTKDSPKKPDNKEQEVTSTTDDSQLEKETASCVENYPAQIIV